MICTTPISSIDSILANFTDEIEIEEVEALKAYLRFAIVAVDTSPTSRKVSIHSRLTKCSSYGSEQQGTRSSGELTRGNQREIPHNIHRQKTPVHSGFAISPSSTEARNAFLKAENDFFLTGAILDQSTNWIPVIIPTVPSPIRKENRENENGNYSWNTQEEVACPGASRLSSSVDLYVKNSDKIASLKFSKKNYLEWVEDVAEVASNVEIRHNFIRRGESQVTHHVTQLLTQIAAQSSPRSINF
ncbi:hypothetical protein EPUL_004476 [Erysiphe pulchra]|uniref:Uncharacterized protein n=1 Tax=Erysiphe pulchra TaxID=225359 RepID=A0A2S4PS90_9PEZI|nr:hypothetical protein EPUL_004476 [Erysiphe pulchra]